MSMAAGQAVEISNWAIGVGAGLPLTTFLVASAIVMFQPELLRAWTFTKRSARRAVRWINGIRRDVRVNTLLWLTEHRFQNIAAYLGLRPAELGIL